MANPTDALKPLSTTAPESPTTARPLEMDDDDVQESGVLENSQASNTEYAPPPKPPRPMSERDRNVSVLREAFPSIDEAIIKAILTASGGQVEPAFNALLQMTDPDAAKDEDERPPPQPPRPASQQPPIPPSSTPINQLEADELYARQLAEHYENVGTYETRTASRGAAQGYDPRQRRQHQQGMLPQLQDHDKEHSFLDDELPMIKENLRKGFVETQTKFTDWFNTMKKRIDGEVGDPDYQDDGPRPGYGRVGDRHVESSQRRSNDYDRYDADPQLLTDDFAGMKFHADGTPARQPRQMGMGDSDAFRPLPKSASQTPRKVAFKENVEDIGDIYDGSAASEVPKDVSNPGKTSKWQPLSTMELNPIAEDNDPFSLGDSEDEKESKDKVPGTKAEEGDLQKATAEAMADSLVESGQKEESEGRKKA